MNIFEPGGFKIDKTLEYDDGFLHFRLTSMPGVRPLAIIERVGHDEPHEETERLFALDKAELYHLRSIIDMTIRDINRHEERMGL